MNTVRSLMNAEKKKECSTIEPITNVMLLDGLIHVLSLLALIQVAFILLRRFLNLKRPQFTVLLKRPGKTHGSWHMLPLLFQKVRI